MKNKMNWKTLNPEKQDPVLFEPPPDRTVRRGVSNAFMFWLFFSLVTLFGMGVLFEIAWSK